MPELPEVETVCRGLRELTSKVINKIEIFNHRLRLPIPNNLHNELRGAKILSIHRRAKYILILLNNDFVLIIHLGMSGSVTITNDFAKKKHDHLLIELNGGTKLIYNDPRRFGLITIAKKNEIDEHKLFRHLGVEPLSDEFNINYLRAKLKKRKQAIKTTIMNQEIVVGVGNIYVCESLFLSEIHPLTPANEIVGTRLQNLISSIQKILCQAIEQGGSTLKDYQNTQGKMGYFQQYFKVYGRLQEKCVNCYSQIEKIVQTGRSTYFCPQCQKHII